MIPAQEEEGDCDGELVMFLLTPGELASASVVEKAGRLGRVAVHSSASVVETAGRLGRAAVRSGIFVANDGVFSGRSAIIDANVDMTAGSFQSILG
jgi:hypothetical protein